MIADDIFRQRDARSRVFGDLPEAAFLIVLDLWRAEAKGKRSNIAAASIGARAPETTVKRHLARLETEGLITREQAADRRMQWLSLTDRARLKLGDFMRQCGEEQRAAVPEWTAGPPVGVGQIVTTADGRRWLGRDLGFIPNG